MTPALLVGGWLGGPGRAPRHLTRHSPLCPLNAILSPGSSPTCAASQPQALRTLPRTSPVGFSRPKWVSMAPSPAIATLHYTECTYGAPCWPFTSSLPRVTPLGKLPSHSSLPPGSCKKRTMLLGVAETHVVAIVRAVLLRPLRVMFNFNTETWPMLSNAFKF